MTGRPLPVKDLGRSATDWRKYAGLKAGAAPPDPYRAAVLRGEIKLEAARPSRLASIGNFFSQLIARARY
jgi:hypothetical protein